MIITLADRTDTYNFHPSLPLKWLASGAFVPLTRWDRVKDRARTFWRWLTRAPRTVCTDIDLTSGTITLGTQRWSWWRWRWL